MEVIGPDAVPGHEAETAARLAAIVESSADAIIGTTLDGVITSWNAGAEHMYGYAAGEIVGRNVSELIPPDRAGELAPILDRLRRGERVEPFETKRRRKDGTHHRRVGFAYPRSGTRRARWPGRRPWPGT